MYETFTHTDIVAVTATLRTRVWKIYPQTANYMQTGDSIAEALKRSSKRVETNTDIATEL